MTTSGYSPDVPSDPDPDDLPAALPIEPLDGVELYDVTFPDGDSTPETPFGAAFLWYQALGNVSEYRHALDKLSVNHAAWNGYTAAAHALDGWSILSRAHDSQNKPGKVAYIKFIPDGDYPAGRATAGAPLERMAVRALVKCEDGWWRARSLTVDQASTAEGALTVDPEARGYRA